MKCSPARSLPILLMGLAAGPASFAQTAPPPPKSVPSPLTLSEAVAIALAHQPQRFIAADTTTSARGAKQQAQSLYFPSIVPTYSYQNRSSAIFNQPTRTITTPDGTTTVVPDEVTIVRGGGLSVGVSQNLFDSGQRELTNARARHALQSAIAGEETTRQGIILNVTQDYFAILQDQDQVKVAQAQIDRFQQTLEQTRAQIENQVSAPNDIYQSQADLASAQVTLTQAESAVRNAEALLKNDLGVASTEPITLAPLSSGEELPPIPAEGATRTLDEYVAAAYAHRPDLLQAQDAVESANAAVKQAEIDAGLSISATGTVSYQATNDVGDRGVDTALIVTGNYPLFDAGNARGAVRQAQAQRDTAVNQLAQTRLNIGQEVEQAYSTRAAAYRAAQLAGTAVTAAQVNYNSAIAGRREGVKTVVDVTTAQATLTQAESQYVQAIYAFYTADAALQHAIGQAQIPTTTGTGAPASGGLPVTGGPMPPGVETAPPTAGTAPIPAAPGTVTP